ncbi:MAG: ribonuclease HII [Chloroflexi bacterium]|nr:ribonuclease HII [Chloroflexota bacterium]
MQPSAGAVERPSLDFERRLRRAGSQAIAGLDEAGRGSWLGPVVAAAVILPRPTAALVADLAGLRDSKQMTARQRKRLAARIAQVAVAVGVGRVEAATIDLVGLGAAGQLAFLRAVRGLTTAPDYLLVDGFHARLVVLPQQALVRGDARSLSIAAASVVAKVTRDALLEELDERFPGFALAANKGYGTPAQQAALAALGPCEQHRLSYRPLRLARQDEAVVS